MQFARVAHATGFVYCYSILDANRRSDYVHSSAAASTALPARAPSKAQLLALERSMASELNTFFPFDPYKLPRSGEYIQGVYREWASVAIDDEDDEDEDDEDDEGDDDEGAATEGGDEDEASAGSRSVGIFIDGARQDDDTEGLGASFGGMSISPARPAHPSQAHILVV